MNSSDPGLPPRPSPLRKWYFAVNEAGLDRTRRQIQVAVQSCKDHAGLQPHCLFSGADPSRVNDLKEMGVQIVPHRPLLEKELRQGYGDEKYEIFCGHWLRSDLPLVETEEEFVLYTDIDVMFRHSLDALEMPTAAVAAAPEHDQAERRYFNSGVLLMNLPVMRGLLPEFHDAIRARLSGDFKYPPHDQASFNEFYRSRMEWLPPEYNWKPYWGVNEAAAIIHFHGPKPRQVLKLKEGRGDHLKPSLKTIWNRDPVAYDHYVKEFVQCLATVRAEKRKRSAARRARRARLAQASA